MRFTPLRIPDVILIEPDCHQDERGFFMEAWQRRKFEQAGINADFVQDNHSRSVKGTLRGLHYQIRQPQGKLVRVTAGEVFDVAVDLRAGSATLGQWIAQYLSAENRRMLWIPPGFAHGYYVTSEFAEFLYKCTDYYAPEHERTIRWDDRELSIEWPLSGAPMLSLKDGQGIPFAQTVRRP